MMSEFEIRNSSRAKRLSVTAYPGGRIVLTKPLRVSQEAAESFLRKHEAWIEEALAKFERRKKRNGNSLALPRLRKGTKAYKQAREAARALVRERLKHFNAFYGFPYGSISIRDQKTRWGSCSAAGNLSFNYRIIFLPPELQDYIVVHELAHVKEHNHSDRFWRLVGEAISDHKERRKELKRYAS